MTVPHLLRAFGIVACIMIGAASEISAQPSEYVHVRKVMDDNAVVVRRNGSTYLIEKGVGCLSLWRLEGKQVIVSSPGLFLGVGSKLVLPDLNQECRVWNSKLIDDAASSGSATTDRSLSAAPADDFSFFDSRGRASVYLDISDGMTFYLGSGEPTAYLDDSSVYGFNGKHLGWFAGGRVYDHDGNVVVAPPSAFSTPLEPPAARGLTGC